MAGEWRPSVDDFVTAAAVILDADEAAIRRLPGLKLAESALAAPFAGFAGSDAYPTLDHLARNHPLPDGNKRVALALTVLFLERNGRRWGEPDHDLDVATVERIASGGATSEAVIAWLQDRTSQN